MTFLAFSSIALCFLLAFLLISKKGKTQSDYILIAWLSVTAAELAIFHIDYYWLYQQYSWLFGIKAIFPFLHAPLIALYTLSMIKGRRQAFHIVLNFLPALLFLLSQVPFWLQPVTERIELIDQIAEGRIIADASEIIGVFILAYVATYLAFSFRLTRNTIKKSDNPNIKWLYLLLSSYIILWVGVAISAAIVLFKAPEYYQLVAAISLFGFTIFVWLIAIIGIKETQLFYGLTEKVERTLNIKKRYEKSGLNEQDAEHYLLRLREYIELEKPYLDSHLSLKKMAEELEISENHLSQTINQKLDCNFFDLINEYRIEEFKNKVIQNEYDYLTLFAIAQQCGFNSKSTFNIAFKKMTGLTPSQYKSQIRELIPN